MPSSQLGQLNPFLVEIFALFCNLNHTNLYDDFLIKIAHIQGNIESHVGLRIP